VTQPGPRESTRTASLWIALLVAFSPVLVDFAQHLIANPWALYTLIFPMLFARCAARRSAPFRKHWDGAIWIARALLLELFAILVGMLRAGRVAVLIACVGLCRRFALASGPTLVLLLFSVPVPTRLLKLTSPELPGALLDVAGHALDALGVEVVWGARAGIRASHQLILSEPDGGLPLASLLAGISWYASLLVKRPPWKAAIRAGIVGVLALPIQVSAIGISLLVLPITGEPLAREALTYLPWISVAVVGVALAAARARQGSKA